MTRSRALPASLATHFSVGDALAAGATTGRLRGSDLVRTFRGVRSTKRTDAVELVLAYAVKLRPGEHVSHASALVLVGGWVPDRLRSEVDVAAVRPTGRARGAGVRGHEAVAASMWQCGGTPIAHPADAWCQLAGYVTERELVIAGDALLRRQRPILALADLEAAVERRRGRPGVARLRAALAQVRERTDSVAETELRLDAVAAGLPEFEVNAVICDEDGRFVAFGDLVDAERKVLLEYDGEQHRVDDAQYARDIERLDELARLGWRIIRVNKSHRGPTRRRQLERTRDALVERGWCP